MLTLFGAVWNLILAGIASGFLWILLRFFYKGWGDFSRMEKGAFMGLSLLFILMYPNIPYIFTDVRHVLDYCGTDDSYRRCWEAAWSIPLYFTYACLGIPFFVWNTAGFARLMGKVFNPLLEALVPPLLVPLACLGILIGLFDRLNSWDLFLRPVYVVEQTLQYVRTAEHLLLLGVFSGCYLALFYLFAFQKNWSAGKIKET